MSNEWKGRVIRGGIVVVGAMGLIGVMVGLIGAMGGLTGVMVGLIGAMVGLIGAMGGLTGAMGGLTGASVIILAVAACIGAASVIVVNIPSRSRTGRRRCRRDQNRPWRRRGTRRVVCRQEYREGANHQRPSQVHRIPLGPLGNDRRQLWS